MKFVVLLVSTCLLASAMTAPSASESAPGNVTETGHHDHAPHVDAAAPHVGAAAHHVDTAAHHADAAAPHVSAAAPHVSAAAPHVDAATPPVAVATPPVAVVAPPVAVKQPSVAPVPHHRVAAPVFTETELMKEMGHRMQGLIEITEWNKLGFPIDEDHLEEALHSTNKFACTSPAQIANMLPIMHECKMKEKAMKENKTHPVDKTHLHMMTGHCFFKKLVGFNNVTGAVDQHRIIREIENTTLTTKEKEAARSDFLTCWHNKKMPVPHLLVKMQMANQKKMNALVTEWMTTMMNNNAEMSAKAAEHHKHMKEHLVVKKAMICKVAALMANGCAKDELNVEDLV